MTPYYEDTQAGITIYHGDARDIVPNLSPEAVITDPPYGFGLYPTDKAVAVLPVLTDLHARARVLAVFGYPEMLAALCADRGWKPDEWVTWWPTNAGLRGFSLRGLRKESEAIAIFGPSQFERLRQERGESSRRILEADYPKGCVDSHGEPESRRLGDVWTDHSPGLGFQSHLRRHPNEKPREVLSRLVEALSDAGDMILDPFMGSGTTLVAAKNLGRRAIGIEIEEKYCEVAAHRLEQGVLQLQEKQLDYRHAKMDERQHSLLGEGPEESGA